MYQTSRRLILMAILGLHLVGCALVGPHVSWRNNTVSLGQGAGHVSVSLDFVGDPSIKKRGYSTQYVQADVVEFVIGLFDAYAGGDAGQAPNLGFEFANGTSASVDFGTPAPSYIEVLGGTSGTIGRLRDGNAEIAGSEGTPLARADLRDGARWLIVKRNAALDALSKSTSFSNLKPGSNRYYLFAAAFMQSPAATESHLAGYNHAGPFGIGAGETVVQNLSVTLNYGLGNVSNTTTIDEATPSVTPI